MCLSDLEWGSFLCITVTQEHFILLWSKAPQTLQVALRAKGDRMMGSFRKCHPLCSLALQVSPREPAFAQHIQLWTNSLYKKIVLSVQLVEDIWYLKEPEWNFLKIQEFFWVIKPCLTFEFFIWDFYYIYCIYFWWNLLIKRKFNFYWNAIVWIQPSVFSENEVARSGTVVWT